MAIHPIQAGEQICPVLHNLLLAFCMAALFAGCATGGLPSRAPAAVAVWDLEDLSPTVGPQPDLGEIFSATIIDTIKSEGTHPVVERQRLVLALEELNLGSSRLADESTRLRIGEMAGAQLMVFGAYQRIGDLIRLDVRLVNVATGKVVNAAQRTVAGADLSTWLEAAKGAALELLD